VFIQLLLVKIFSTQTTFLSPPIRNSTMGTSLSVSKEDESLVVEKTDLDKGLDIPDNTEGKKVKETE